MPVIAIKPASCLQASVFTVDLDNSGAQIHIGQRKRDPNDASFDLARITFRDSGFFDDPGELQAGTPAIRQARTANPNGAVVVVFIHGWHHNAAWDVGMDSGDAHFREFRNVLAGLALREAERYLRPEEGGEIEIRGGRRVVGIYLGWNGDPANSWRVNTLLNHTTFWGRYDVAKKIGAGNDLRAAVRQIVASTKDPLDGQQTPESPLILIGHSMGALMLESAFLSLLRAEDDPLVRAPGNRDTVQIRKNGQRISFPDVLIAVNSAADSQIAKDISAALQERKLEKTFISTQIRYAPPLFISVTSTADAATGWIWRTAQGLHFGRRTDGHDKSLLTHRFTREDKGVQCEPAGAVDKGQNWHCLRRPAPNDIAMPNIDIDLPTREREGLADRQVPHDRYRLSPIRNAAKPHLAWLFQVPREVTADHNDIFNSRARLLLMAMIQLSGAVMSLARDWERNFEPQIVQ